RQLTIKQRQELLAWRKQCGYPWHSPPHRPNFGHLNFLVTAACYEHKPHIGFNRGRIDVFSRDLLALIQQSANRTVAWCVLPNHYYLLVEAPDIKKLLAALGRL